MSGVFGPSPMAGWVPLSALQPLVGLDHRKEPVSLCQLPSRYFPDRRNGLSEYPQTLDDVVPSHVVRDQPEKRGQCHGTERRFGTSQLPNRLDLVAQVASGDGAAGAGSTAWKHRAGRILFRRAGRRISRA